VALFKVLYLVNACGETGENDKLRTVRLPPEIRTGHLLNAIYKRYRFTQLPEHVLGSGGIAPSILKLGTGWR
jgi:hypothetical protein